MATAELAATGGSTHYEETFALNIEGHIHRWPVAIIIPEQVALLGGWDISAGVVLVDEDNNERQLQPGEIVHLKPGIAFAKKVNWKRGR